MRAPIAAASVIAALILAGGASAARTHRYQFGRPLVAPVCDYLVLADAPKGYFPRILGEFATYHEAVEFQYELQQDGVESNIAGPICFQGPGA